MKTRVILLLSLLYGSGLSCMEHEPITEHKKPILCVIHEFSEVAYTRRLLPEFNESKRYIPNHPDTHRDNNLPKLLYDLGQTSCIVATKKNMEQLENLPNQEFIFFATDEGTLTALNYVMQKPNRIKALILDASFASGNSAIFHRAHPLLTTLPLSYYWLPYLAKFRMPFYSPIGKQPILNMRKINVPIILVDNPKNKSFNDTKALYAGLHSQGNTTYLFSVNKDNPAFHNLTEINQKEVLAIRKILQNHHILPNNAHNVSQDDDLSAYQPEPDKNVYNALVDKEKVFYYINPLLKLAALGILVTVYIQSI
jgi:hypothetical protein